MIKDRIVIIDGNSLINRAFYALPPLTTKEGQHTNAMYGFLTMLFKVFDDFDPEYIGVAFDLKAPTFRHIEYGDYKLGRKKMPSELAQQMEPLKELLDVLNIFRVEIEGYEADDLIGTLSKYCEARGMESLIVTGDKDALQLASKTTKILITKKGISSLEIYNDDRLLEDFEVTPQQFIDLKGLMGDKSDNIPGVPGVGEKTAIKLIKQFGNVEALIENTHLIEAAKLKEKIENHISDITLSKRLATIITDIPVEIDLEMLKRRDAKYHELIQLLRKYEFNSLVNKFSKAEDIKVNRVEECNAVNISDIETFTTLAKSIKEKGSVVIHSITDGNNTITDEIVAIALTYDTSTQYYIDFRSFKEKSELIDRLKLLMEDAEIRKISHDIKREAVHFYVYGIEIKNIAFDTMIAEYLIDASKSSYGLKELANLYLEESISDLEELIGKGKSLRPISEASEEELQNYLSQQARTIQRLYEVLKDRLMEMGLERLYYEVELPLTQVLASMEFRGIKVDKNMLQILEIEFKDMIDKLTAEIYMLAGREFNINSPKQLGEVLFEDLGLPPIKKTKTGYSTNAEVLDKLADRHEVIPRILEYRHVTKLKSTYVDGLLGIINPVTNRIHSSFNQTVTTTGRISSTEPNLQNIPVRLEMGRQLRKVFIAEEGFRFIDADYSQIELRVLAHISKDENMIDAFKRDQDIHIRTASEIFDIPMEEVTPQMRSSAKAVNFGIVYGISDFGLSENLKISRLEAKKYIDSYLDKYQQVKKYMQDIIADAKDKGYVVTLLNRRRYLPEIYSTNFNIRSFGERLALNTPIQGTAADIIKIAMVKVYNHLQEHNTSASLILQVHDELIVEAPAEEAEMVAGVVKKSMEEAMTLLIDLKVDLAIADNWYDAK